MTEQEALLDTLGSLNKNDPDNFNDYLVTLNVIATLMNEVGGKRLTTASYTRSFIHDRLNVTIQYKKEN